MNAIVVYVWFRADPARNDEVRRLLGSLGQTLAAHFGVTGRFGWRDEPEKQRRTWLECWEPLRTADEQAFVAALQTQARAIGLESIATDGRYVDVFRWAGELAPG